MKIRDLLKITTLLISTLLIALPSALAQSGQQPASTPSAEQQAADSQTDSDKAKEKEEEENDDPDELQAGVVASFGKFSKTAAISTSGDTEVSGGASVISGSVTRKGKKDCVAKLISNTKDSSYSVRYRVRGFSMDGKMKMDKSYTATVRPGETVTRTLRCKPKLNMQVVISSGRKLGG